MVFGGFWEDLPVIFQGDPPPSKRVVIGQPPMGRCHVAVSPLFQGQDLDKDATHN